MNSETALKCVMNFRFLWKHPAHLIALGFGSGLLMAPGTMGTLLAWLLFEFVLSNPIAAWLGLTQTLTFQWTALLFLLGATLVAWWACAHVEKSTQQHDNRAVVVDEVVAFWWILWIVPSGFGWQLTAFLVFRWFDIVKPQPIRWLDQKVKGGLGVMVDDLMAAFYTLVLLAVVYQILK